MAKFSELTVSDVEKLNGDAVAVSFDVPEKNRADFNFLPGQYLTLETKIDGEKVRRSYSICCALGKGLRVGIKRVEGGKFSTHAQTLSVGDTVEVMPPEGRFICDPQKSECNDILLIAAGSGITPILSIASSLLEDKTDCQVTLIYGNQKTASIMFREEIEDLKDRYLERFHVFHVLSREAQDVELFHGRIDVERITDMASKGILDLVGADGIYLCGPAPMTLALKEHFVGLGVEDSKVFTELFEAPDDDRPVKISEETAKVAVNGVNVEVIMDGLHKKFILSDPNQTVLQAAETSGLDLPFSCAGGMCATCRCKVVEGQGEMDKNFSLDTWELEAGYVLACQLRPKSQTLKLDFDAT